MHGAYDLSLTRSSEDQEIDQTRNLMKLPKSLRYANDRFLSSNPWPRSLLPGDFILIAEFSEHEGPKPVMTIPKNGGGNFDINAFAVHVMSVDYQVQSRESSFSMVEDTQLFLTEAKQNIFAYVHHFTLYDIHARGFVRPFCMCYISHYKRKMLSFLNQLMDEFTKVSRLFKHGNRLTFSMDLEQRLADAFAIRDEMTIADCPSFAEKPWKWLSEGTGSSKSNTKKEFEYILKETRRLISVLKPHMNDPRIEEQFKRLESLAEGRNYSYTTDHTTFINQRALRHKLHSSFGQPEPFRRAVSLPDLRNHVQRTKEVHPSPLLPSYLDGIKQLRHLHELCEWGTKEGINRLGNILNHFGRDMAALMIEEMDARHLERLPSLLTIGRSVVCNVLQKIDMKCLRHRATNCCCSKSLHQGSPTRKSSTGSLGSLYSFESFESCLDYDLPSSSRSSDGILSPFTPSCSFHADLHGGETPRQSRAGSASEDSDAVSLTLSDTSFTSPELRLSEYALLDEHFPLTLKDMRPSFGRQTSAMLARGIHTNVSIQTTRKSLSLESLAAVSSDGTSSTRRMQSPLPYLGLQGEGASVARSGTVRVPAIRVVEAADRKHSSSSGSSKGSRHGRALKRAKSDESSGTCSFDGGIKSIQRKFNFLRPERIRLRCFAEEVCQAVETYAGSNVLLLRRNWSCIIHLVFALLCGRPVVVLADPGNEREVRTLISALWMFVPENTRFVVRPRNGCGKVAVPWRKKPLQIADLAWLKLAGLAKSKRCNVIPKSVKRFVSVLDYEAGLIATPPYKGYYLHSICNLTKQWPTNAAFVAFIHSVFLELANKAYVYYHAYCLRGLQLCVCKSQRSTNVPVADVYEDGSDVLSKLGVHFSDAKIVQYLTEVIKQQQIDYQQNLSTEQVPHSTQEYKCMGTSKLLWAQPDNMPGGNLRWASREELTGEGELAVESESPVERGSPLIVTDLSKCALFRNVKPLEF